MADSVREIIVRRATAPCLLIPEEAVAVVVDAMDIIRRIITVVGINDALSPFQRIIGVVRFELSTMVFFHVL